MSAGSYDLRAGADFNGDHQPDLLYDSPRYGLRAVAFTRGGNVSGWRYVTSGPWARVCAAAGLAPAWEPSMTEPPTAPRDGVRERIEAGRAAWPGLDVDEAAYEQHVVAHAPDGVLPPLEFAGDLWIACACALGVRGAAGAFERAFRQAIERAVARVDGSVVDEATQRVLVSLLVREGDGPPRIADYGGRSSLRTWLATVASRMALRTRGRRDDRGHDSLSLADAVVAAEPELAFARARYGPALQDALRDALIVLQPRQVVLLRLHHAQGWSVDRLGESFGTSRSTAQRWVAAAREALLEETKRLLSERLELTPSELDSLVGILRSQMDVSLLRLLESDAG
jgi:RNA polymerase sigma-70 factor (ECF subfamily)